MAMIVWIFLAMTLLSPVNDLFFLLFEQFSLKFKMIIDL